MTGAVTTSLTTVANTVPLALLPVRLETRYLLGATGLYDLMVRVYPDQIHRDAHQPVLTVDEVTARDTFRTEGGYGTDPNAPDAAAAWARLADRYGPGRAAWIVRSGLPGAANPTPRPAAWTDPVWARCLPDRWVVYGYRGGAVVVTAYGSTIPGDLAVSPGPNETPPPVPAPPPGCPPGGELRVPPSIAWMVDPAVAQTVGMAVRVPLGSQPHLDRLLVFGVYGEAPTAGADRLGKLLSAHHYTDGLGLVGQGTPTNNTTAGPSGLTTDDPGQAGSRARERGPARCTTNDGSDGARLAAALGVPADTLANAIGADGRESLDAQAMNAALWPATWGAFLSKVVPADPATLEPYRRHFIDFVRARGPLSALRVGNQPYGVLPATSLARLQSPAGSDQARIADLTNRARTLWANAAGAFGPGNQKIRDVLRRRPVSDGYAVRGVFSTEWLPSSLSFMGLSHATAQQRHDMATAQTVAHRGLLGGPATWFSVLNDVLTMPQPWPGTLSTMDPGGDPAATPAWVAALLQRLLAVLPADPEASWAGKPADSLLYVLLLHAARLVGTTAATTTPAPATRGGFGTAADPAGPAPLPEFISALTRLSGRTGATLDRLTRETLDLAGNRPDAWATSLATRRLAQLRTQSGNTGVVVGGYGWLENLNPRGGDTPVAVGDTPQCEQPGLVVRAGNAGYLQAPSLPQATTAAVLRSANLTHIGETTPTGTTPFAIDLSSTRVRLAQSLLSGLRQDQSLGVLLGYRFERALQEAGATAAASIPAFRALAPAAPSAGTARRADDVADGLVLLTRFTAGTIPWGQNGLPTQPVAAPAFTMLRNALDALADATTAESLHQMLQGNHLRASAALAIGQVDGVLPDSLEFLRTPRPGSTLTHRLLVMLDAPPLVAGAPGGWTVGPRETAEPALAAWLARLLGSPARVRADVELRDPATGDPAGPVRRTSLADLGIAPLDLLACATTPADLDRRLGLYLLDDARRPVGVPANAVARLLPDPASPLGGTDVYLADLMPAVRAVATALAAARPLDARDVDPAAADPGADPELSTRATAAQTGIGQAIAAVDTAMGTGAGVADPAGLRVALRGAASYGIPGALPASAAGTDADTLDILRRQAVAVRAELDRRRQAAVAAGADARAALQAVFGTDFTVVPRFRTADPAALARGFTGTQTSPAPAGQEPLAWFARMARIRAGVAGAETLGGYAQALRTGGLTLTIGQVPAPAAGAPAVRWAGLPPASPTDRVPADAVSLVAFGAAPAATGSLAGLLLDEWREVLPARRQTTGIAYHYDAPGSQAPQSLLLAVSPRTDAGMWNADDLAAVLSETLDMARGRAVDVTDIGLDMPLLGPLYLPHQVPEPGPVVPVGRLAAAPAGYGVPQPAPPPLLNPPPPNRPDGTFAVRQGKSVTLTVTGQNLYGQTWSTTSPGITVSAAPNADTSAVLTITVAPTAPLGAASVRVTAWGGQATIAFTVLPRPLLSGLTTSPATISQSVIPSVATVTLTGQQLAGATATVTGSDDVTATVTGSTATSLTVRLTIAGNPKPAVDWDPTEPGGPLKPPQPHAIYAPTPLTINVTVVREADQSVADTQLSTSASGLPLSYSALIWETY